ncbi:MAG: type 4a pilus biogenesis protein PilO [Fimbriimonadaceae bacterium]
MKLDFSNPTAMAMASVGLVLLVASGVFVRFSPAPQVKTAVAKSLKDQVQYRRELVAMKLASEEKTSEVAKRLWTVPDDKIAPEALNRVSTLAKKHAVKMTTFRPQKEIPAGALSILPFFVSVDGPFPAVAAFLEDFEQNEPLLVLSTLQVTTTDQISHNVTAAVGISAYVDPNRSAAKPASAGPVVNVAKRPPTPLASPTKKTPETDATHSARVGSTGQTKA